MQQKTKPVKRAATYPRGKSAVRDKRKDSRDQTIEEYMGKVRKKKERLYYGGDPDS